MSDDQTPQGDTQQLWSDEDIHRAVLKANSHEHYMVLKDGIAIATLVRDTYEVELRQADEAHKAELDEMWANVPKIQEEAYGHGYLAGVEEERRRIAR